MKDATGELSMTAIAVVAIAAIGVVFTTLVWPQIRTNIMRSTYCSQAVSCDCKAAGAGADSKADTMCSCTYCEDEKCEKSKTISCPRTGGGTSTGGSTSGTYAIIK